MNRADASSLCSQRPKVDNSWNPGDFTPPGARALAADCNVLPGGPADAPRRGTERSSDPGPTGTDAPIVRPRQHGARPLHRQLPRRTGPARPRGRERRPGRRGSNRVCRRARTGDGRFHPIHIRRSSQAGPDITVAGPAAVFARKYRQQLFPDTPLLFAAVDQRYCAAPRLGTTRPPSRRSTTFLVSSITSCNCCPRPGRCSW